jgi:nucleotide-binding universal stress UspA family protein
MSYRNLLVHLDESERSSIRLDVAIQLGQRFGATLCGLFAQSDSSAISVAARRSSDYLRNAAERTRAQFESATTQAGVPSRWWQLGHGEFSHVIGETVICSRYTGLAVLGQYDTGNPDSRVPPDLVEEVVLNAGRPVLVVPYAGPVKSVGQRVVIAWNASREAARAINDALPLMQGAKSVLVLALRPPRAEMDIGSVPQVDILQHLAINGINATLERMSVEGILPMDAVLSRASDESADLLVMGGFGAYGDMAFSLFQRGRNTRHILRQMTLPVLLSN